MVSKRSAEALEISDVKVASHLTNLKKTYSRKKHCVKNYEPGGSLVPSDPSLTSLLLFLGFLVLSSPRQAVECKELSLSHCCSPLPLGTTPPPHLAFPSSSLPSPSHRLRAVWPSLPASGVSSGPVLSPAARFPSTFAAGSGPLLAMSPRYRRLFVPVTSSVCMSVCAVRVCESVWSVLPGIRVCADVRSCVYR